MECDRPAAWRLLTQYNHDPFHLRHALTMEALMRHFAKENGLAAEAGFWGLVGLLHDVDFERFPAEHCRKAPELLREISAPAALTRAVCSHGWGITVDVKPESLMEKILYAVDELSGLVWAAALMRPSRSVRDMELKSVKKKFKDRKFAAGCSREVIARGADLLGWPLDALLEKTLEAMRACEAEIDQSVAQLTGPRP
ncbi:MAG: hydrolase [Planctomycetes bacterium]|nr:hydrolase [Planctomycetota bacterium]